MVTYKLVAFCCCFLGSGGCINPSQSMCGGALGPDWSSDLTLCGACSSQADKAQRQVHVEYECEVKHMFEPEEFKMSGLKESPLPSNFDGSEISLYEQNSSRGQKPV